jgi:rRNA maturation RNase YbeY
MEQVDRPSPSLRWAQLTIILTDHQGMQPVNRAVFQREETTDVISLVYPPVAALSGGMEGEVIVNVEQAMDCGGADPGAAERELAWYLAHGCNHLGGADDDTPARRAAMHDREQAWLAEAEQRGLLPGLIRTTGAAP